ncbi:hypothetical protein [Streptomyces sp. bgisy034]|uniref:hypothetical protein n=1 Tax=Streptomyces sp. bgisy034 TaxID=3413774 RepID=UPI003EB8C4C4
MTSSEPGERRAAGEQVVREMFGETFLRKNMVVPAEGTGPGADMARLALEQCFGEIWSRPGLDRRGRSLVTLGGSWPWAISGRCAITSSALSPTV